MAATLAPSPVVRRNATTGAVNVERRTIATWLRDELRSRVDGIPAWALMVQIFIGLGWTRAAVEKIISPGWWSGQELTSFLATHDALPWFAPFLDHAVAPMLLVTAVIVVVLQASLGALMLLGRRPMTTLTVGIALNLVFIASGAVNPSVFYILAQGSVILWLVESRVPTEAEDRIARTIPFALALAVLNLPFIRTLAPAHVIEDPAIIMVTIGLLVTLASLLIADRRSTARTDLPEAAMNSQAALITEATPITPRLPRPVRSSPGHRTVATCRTAATATSAPVLTKV